MSGQEGGFHYKAFISYSHVNKTWGDWIHKQIETYVIPKRLVGTPGCDGPIPKRLFPVFRDREELPSSHDLNEQITQALQQSAYMIVICSPQSAKSRWVNEEIMAFKRLGRENRILALIIDGEPNATDKGKPNKECFPEALRFGMGADGKLNDERHEAIAADVRPQGDGKKNALLKIIAGLLGVSFDTLAQRDKQRKKARMQMTLGVSTVAALGLSAAAFGWWYQNAPHTEYYRNFATRYGVPQGVGKISEAEARHSFDSFAITTQKGRVIEMRYEKSNLKPNALPAEAVLADSDLVGVAVITIDYAGDRGFVTTLRDEAAKSLGTKEYTYVDERKTAATVSLKSQSGDVRTLDTSTQSQGQDDVEEKFRSAITQYRLSFDASGRVKTKAYRTAMGDPAADPSGSFGNRYDYNTDGLPVSVRNLDSDGHFIPLKSGVSQVTITYTMQSLPADITWLDENNQPALNPQGTARTHYVRDSHGNAIEKDFTGTDGKPAPRKDTCASKVTYRYDEQGRNIEQAFFDEDGKPILTREGGMARFTNVYDADGNLIEQAYFGLDDKPVLDKKYGAARMKWNVDAKGNILAESYFASDGKPVLMKLGNYASRTMVYDTRGNRIQRDTFGTDGKPVLDKEGVARIVWRYDEHDNLVDESYFGADGKPTLKRDTGAARIHFGYDARGNENEESFFGVDGKPVLSEDWGVARATYVYDNRGNKTRIDNFGIDGKPVISPKLGYVSATYRYDERGNQIEEAYLGVDGKPTLNQRGLARIVAAYDERGNLVEESYFGIDGKPAINTEVGYARYTVDYDKRGNQIAAAYFGTDGRPTLLKDAGIARITWDYDIRGNKIGQSYFGIDGRPVMAREEGYARMTTVLDPHGNEIEADYFGVNGEPVLVNTFGYAKVTSGYDARGNKVVQACFGTDGKPIINQMGFASVTNAYDALGMLIEEAYFGIDGKPILSDEGFARAVYAYDARGNQIGWAYFDTEGKPVAEKGDGIARYTATYDESGNLIESHAYDARGKPVKTHDPMMSMM